MTGMTRLVVCALLCACTETHTPAQVEITQEACINCHSGTLIHPEDIFPLASNGTMHDGIDCTECHRFSVGPGLNLVHADCFHCHFRADIDPTHTPMPDYTWDPINHDFCLRCHPDGKVP